ncbi:MAG: glycerophosphodiester phosphodiesterase family protein, partial [Paracoccus sp. (in: a-proteobacteria)]|nr:glycerophosphodiester phosphodiesterase family protein [Paracoccus sp. (in: a-proteobacteria)]
MPLHPDFMRLPLAHRGLHGPDVPENSRAAFRAAIGAGYGIELDIQPAADGTPMVFHDDDLMRMCGEGGHIRDLGPDDLARMRLAGSDETIPTLAATLRDIAGQVPLLIEIKDQDGRLGGNTGDLQDRVAALLESYDGPVAIMSFNPDTVAAFGRAAPAVTRGLTSCAFARDDWPMLDDKARARLGALADFDRIGGEFISHDWVDLANPAVAALKARGVPVLCWTIRSPDQAAAARAVADGITFENF